MSKRFVLFTLIALSSLFRVNSVIAAESPENYQIEVIVFSHITEQGLKSEYWPLIPLPPPLSSDVIELSEEQILPENDWQLKSVEKQLRQTSNVVLLHIAWQQTATDLRNGQTFHLFGGSSYDHDLWQVNGPVNIQLERYFQVYLNLQFLIPWDKIAPLNLTNIAHDNDADYVRFKINERFKMRSNELNYVDHPLYGVLIQITHGNQ